MSDLPRSRCAAWGGKCRVIDADRRLLEFAAELGRDRLTSSSCLAARAGLQRLVWVRPGPFDPAGRATPAPLFPK
jgi:hypothetical protein